MERTEQPTRQPIRVGRGRRSGRLAYRASRPARHHRRVRGQAQRTRVGTTSLLSARCRGCGGAARCSPRKQSTALATVTGCRLDRRDAPGSRLKRSSWWRDRFRARGRARPSPRLWLFAAKGRGGSGGAPDAVFAEGRRWRASSIGEAAWMSTASSCVCQTRPVDRMPEGKSAATAKDLPTCRVGNHRPRSRR